MTSTPVAITTINTSTPNSGLGDTIYVAFTKTNGNFGNLASAVDLIQNNYANTTLAQVANLQVTNQVLGSVYLNTGTVYINGSPVATAANTFPGGNVGLQANFLAALSSISSNTGAVTIPYGGLGVYGNVYSGGQGTFNGTLLANSGIDSSSYSTGAIVSTGPLA